MQLSKRIGLFFMISLLILSFSSLFASEGGNCRDVATASANHFADKLPESAIEFFNQLKSLTELKGEIPLRSNKGEELSVEYDLRGDRMRVNIVSDEPNDILILEDVVSALRKFVNWQKRPLEVAISSGRWIDPWSREILKELGFRDASWPKWIRAMEHLALRSSLYAGAIYGQKEIFGLTDYSRQLLNGQQPLTEFPADIFYMVINGIFIGETISQLLCSKFEGWFYPQKYSLRINPTLDLNPSDSSNNQSNNPYAPPNY